MLADDFAGDDWAGIECAGEECLDEGPDSCANVLKIRLVDGVVGRMTFGIVNGWEYFVLCSKVARVQCLGSSVDGHGTTRHPTQYYFSDLTGM